MISERLPHVRSAAIGYWIGAGSRDETDARAGVSHFIEHLLFKGSSRYSALEIAEIFDEIGGELNAATSREHTVVFARVPDNHVETALDVMGDMVFSPLFDDLDSEREVVLEEIAMYEDTPQELVHDLIGEAVFGSHALGRPVIGTAEVISSVTQRALRSLPPRLLHARRTSSSRPPGSIDHDQLVALVQRSVERRGGTSAGKPRVRPLLVKSPKPGLRFQRKDTEQYHVCLGATGVSRSDRRRFAASILDAILGGSASSRLFQEIREKRGMAYCGLQLPLAVRRHRADRDLRRDARGQPRRGARDRGRADRRHRLRQPRPSASSSAPRRTSRAALLLSMESTSARMTAAREVARRPTPRSSRSTA